MELTPRLRFKFERLKSALRAALGSRDESTGSGHRVCPNCRALVERDAASCLFCGALMKSARARAGSTPGRVLGGLIPVPSTATSVLVAVNVAVFLLAWYLSLNLASRDLSSASGGGISIEILARLGAKMGPRILAGEWWRLVTAMFLHAGILHIVLNLWCLIDLGASVESLFSTTKFIVLYLITGLAGFLLSLWWRPLGMSVGASGVVLGLIGVLIGASFHHGHFGKEYRAQLVRWVIYIFIIGILPFTGTDNAAHLGGLAAGVVLGYFVPEGEPVTRTSENLWNALAILSVFIIAASFALMAFQLVRPQ